MDSAPRRVSWVIVLLVFTNSGGFVTALSGRPCAPGLDCENTKCLTVSGIASCCTCFSWDSRGACLEWESSNGQRGGHCNFDVDMYHKSMTTLDTLGDDSCPANTSCEDQRCREVNGVTECCMCTAWEKSGDCKTDGWRGSTGGTCYLTSGQAPATSMLEPGGCPPGLSCEDTKCRNHNGSNTCCRCHRWQSNGRCKSTGWLKESGLGACDFSADDPALAVRSVPQYKVIPRSPLSYRGQEAPAMLDSTMVSLPIAKTELDDMDDNNAGVDLSMTSTTSSEIESGSQDSSSDGDLATVLEPVGPNINADLTWAARDDGVQTSNGGDEQTQINAGTPSASGGGSVGGGGDPHDPLDGQSHKRLRMLLARHKGGCGLNIVCETQQCSTVAGRRSCCMCEDWDGPTCTRWVSNGGSPCTFSVSD